MKKICCALLITTAVIYTLWYMSFGTPYLNSGALSAIGLRYRAYFVIWGLLTYAALSFNIITAYTSRTESKIYIPLLLISAAGMALTLGCGFDYSKKVQYYLHCAGSLTFSAVTGLTIFLLFILLRRKGALFMIFAAVTAAVLITDLICLLIFRETGLIETLPLFAGYALLGATNLSIAVRKGKKP